MSHSTGTQSGQLDTTRPETLDSDNESFPDPDQVSYDNNFVYYFIVGYIKYTYYIMFI